MLAAVIIGVLAVAGYAALNGVVDQIMSNVAADLVITDSEPDRPTDQEPDRPSDQDLPPVGQAWFGHTFDRDTFEIRDRITTVGTTEAFVMVAHLPRSVDGSELVMRVSFDGQLVSTQGANASGFGDLWGWSLGPLYAAGTWGYEITDIGGNVLASGQIQATE